MENKEINSTVVPIGEYAFSQIIKTKTYFFPQPKKKNSHINYSGGSWLYIC